MHKATKIGIVGLGYVGLPLAVAFSRKYPVVGYDIDLERIRQLQQGHDVTFAVTREEIVGSEMLVLSSEVTDLSDCTVFIITVPTPIDAFKNPDLRY